MELTKQKISVGRVLHVYGKKFNGPRAAIVANAWANTPHANLNIEWDTLNDHRVLGDLEVSDYSCEETIGSVPVLDLAEGEAIDEAAIKKFGCEYANLGKVVAVWPPRV